MKKILIALLITFLLPTTSVNAGFFDWFKGLFNKQTDEIILSADPRVLTVPQGGTGAATLTGCLEGNGTLAITATGLPCGSGGGGGGGDSVFSRNASKGLIYTPTTTDDVKIGTPANSTSTRAKLEVTFSSAANGSLAVTGSTTLQNFTGLRSTTSQATTTNLAITSLTSELLKVDGNGTVLEAVSGTDYEVPLTFGDGLTRTANDVDVDTTQNITNLSNLTSNGFVKTSGGNGTLSVDTTTYESGLTAGDGLTRTANDFDCDTASGSVFGCLSAANWTTFNNKQDTITAGDALTLTGTDIDFDGGATPSGDLGGTWASPSVTDDSHAHTGATISGIDISSDTNLTGDSEIVLTGDALSIASTITRDTELSGYVPTSRELTINGTTYDLSANRSWTVSGGGTGNVATSSAETAGQLPYWTSTNGTPATLGGVATTSVTCTGDASCTPFTVIGSSPITINATGGAGGSWATTSEQYYWSQFRDLQVAGSPTYLTPTSTSRGLLVGSLATSTLFNTQIVNGTTTNATSTNLNISGTLDVDGLTSALTLAGSTGIIGEYAGASCTNQFPRSQDASGAWTCATVANTDLANSTISGVSLGSNLAALTAGAGLSSAGTYTGATARTFTIDGSSIFRDWAIAGNGYLAPTSTRGVIISASSTISALTVTNGTTTNATSTNLHVSGTLDIGSLSGVLIGTSGNVSAGVDGTDYTLVNAVSCTNQVVTALTAAGVGTCSSVSNAMLSNSTISGVSLGGTLANLTATDSTLTFSGTYTGATARTIGLNLGNANTWTALQTYSTGLISQASSTMIALTVVNGTTTNATSTNLTVSGTTRFSGLNCAANANGGTLTTDSNGYVSCADDDSSGGGGAYPFAVAGNATSTLTQFNGGLTSYASTTIGNGTQTGGLTISGGATTTGSVKIGSGSATILFDGATGSATTTQATTTSLYVSGTASTTNLRINGYVQSAKIDTAFIFATTTLGTGTTTLKLAGFKQPTSFISFGCSSTGGGTFTAQLGDSNASSTMITSSTGLTTTYTTLSSGNAFTTGETVWFSIGNVSGTVKDPTCSYQRVVTTAD